MCISILHPPGVDPHNQGEQAADRWRPIHSVESIIVSVQSMLNEANCDSPENIDAAVSDIRFDAVLPACTASCTSMHNGLGRVMHVRSH